MRNDALFLFDIDGTLMRGGTQAHRDAFAHAFDTVYGLPLSLDGIPAGGRTDSWLLAEPLRRAGVPAEDIRRLQPEAFRAMIEYVERTIADLRHCVLPGVRDVLASLHEDGRLLGLLIGNLSRIAVLKLEAAGLGGYFDTGGFGEESEDRSHLVPVAIAHGERAAGRRIPPRQVVIIGDTPLDVEAGRTHGTRTVAVATGTFSEAELRAGTADVVLASLADADTAVRAITGLVS